MRPPLIGERLHSAKALAHRHDHRPDRQYAYYACNTRVNRGDGCACPSVRREKLDGIVLDLLERQLLAPARLRELLAGVLDLSDQQRGLRERELRCARTG